MSKPFSVLMSLYKNENPDYLLEALQSIIEQTLKPSEIIIVEDGPLTPRLKRIVSNFARTYKCTRIISLEENVGLGKALKIGTKEAKYEIIARMDTDDIARNDRFEIELACLEKMDCQLVGSNILEFENDKHSPISSRVVPEHDEQIRTFSKRRNPFNHMTVMFQKSAVLNVGNYQEMTDFEDYYLWLRLLKRNYKTYNVQDNLVYARTDADFLKRRSGFQYIKSEYHFQKRILTEKLVGKIDFVINIFSRCLIRLVPVSILKRIYTKFVHRKLE
ncbi:Putative glycosyl transferase family 2, involved in cell wall synthesis [Latilactobacillus curvatus]|uniref:glycosyltransferase n=1 Tax=Latilactobacillus curvatus TaxID=28038 RepID=UPI000A1B71BB|nr:glycosyltransferase [Latilactobacillus curvatus]SMH69119.1 Putative glycosyl transferase family 2, involved in cell wall synthesis [Latilactobacillus curvatus]